MFFRLKDKGQLGYINNRKLARGLTVGIGIAAMLAIFLTGYISTGTRNNILTVASILTALPVAKYIVLLIMVLPYHSEPQELHDKVVDAAGENSQVLAEMIMTSKEKVMPVDYLVVKESHVMGYTSYKKCDIPFAEKFITENMQVNGHKVAVKIWDDEKKFISKIASMGNKEIEEDKMNKDAAIAETLLTLVV